MPPRDVIETGTTDPRVRTWYLMDRGRRLLEAGSAEQALVSFQQGVELATEHRIWDRAALGLVNIGVAFALLGQRDSAHGYIERAREMAPLARSPVVDISVLTELGVLLFDRFGMIDSGQVLLEKAVSLLPDSRKRRVVSSRALAQYNLGVLHAREGRLDTALHYFEQSRESYAKSGRRRRAQALEDKLDALRKALESSAGDYDPECPSLRGN